VQQQTDEGREAAQRAAEHAQAAAASAGLAAGAAAEALGVAAGLAADRGREVVQVVRARASDLPSPVVLEGVLEEAFDRGAEAWDVLRGRRTPPPRWPWATGSALAGAALAVGVAVLVRRLRTQDAPGAQDPEQVQAVVDLPAVPPPPPGGAVDEDGEAVLRR
jgi:F0F1-type ATP synthase membrane subunit c/vacuolar-type H+-ATPase subunit K